MTQLYKNQCDAITTSIENNFKSGIHYHATGTGKSWIAMKLIDAYRERYKNNNILWFCEKKDILEQQFNKKTIKERHFTDILKYFNVLNFSIQKNKNWVESINASKYWNKPCLCIINRAYLTSMEQYKKIKIKFNLIIHDECHTIENQSTKNFYEWIMYKNTEINIIGFSATPLLIKPFYRIITEYNIYQAFCDNVILPPKIIWFKWDTKPNDLDLMMLMKNEIKKLPYQKIIIWCGMIEYCVKIAKIYQTFYNDFLICLDFHNQTQSYNFGSYRDFYNSPGNSILFCAVKHREGSDIPCVDACIFLDGVAQRSEKLFVQCIGRVLRKDKQNKKKYGLIIDLKAKDAIEVCNRVSFFLKLKNMFPWNYSVIKNQNHIYTNILDMITNSPTPLKKNYLIDKQYTKTEIMSLFKRPFLNLQSQRIDFELSLMIEKKIFGNILTALEVLKLTQNIPHVTRGSCGSSLVCYLLGISHVNPVKHNICFSRFLNKFRDTCPDIDLDFPHYLRNEVFLKLYQKWGDKVARISNHNYYHKKSALRESLRLHGIRYFISKYQIHSVIQSLSNILQKKIFTTQQDLEGTFKNFSLHCGGIIYFNEDIPKENIIETSSVIKQVNYNKQDISNLNMFKIDILSSCALSQLYFCCGKRLIDFEKDIHDEKTIQLLQNGDNIGLTLLETPLMKKALLLVKPKSIYDLAIVLSIIRPAAKEAKQQFHSKDSKKHIIFDDDFICIISKLLKCNEDYADKIRRKYSKGDKTAIELIHQHIEYQDHETKTYLKNVFKNIRKYGFCKAHALSYAQLVWQLAYYKAHHPHKFWSSTLKNVSSYYRKWVHLYEAHCYNVNVTREKSIFSEHKKNKIQQIHSPLQQLQTFGVWSFTDSFFPGCYMETKGKHIYFKGLIASSKILKWKHKLITFFIGIDKHKYIDILVQGDIYYDHRKVMISGHGIQQDKALYLTIECESKHVYLI